MFGVDTNEISSLGDIPDCLVPVVLFHEAGVLLEKRMDHFVSTNGREGLGGPDMMDDYILALVSSGANRGMKVEMTLVGDGSPVNGINGFNNFAFVVEDGDIIIKDFLDLGKEVGMD
jgi:hypothetical protein